MEARLAAEHAGSTDLPFWVMTLSYGRHVSEALVAWCDETLDVLRRVEERL